MKERPIHYEPHPVTPERKAELLAEGVRIVDAIFAPPEKPATRKGKGKEGAEGEKG